MFESVSVTGFPCRTRVCDAVRVPVGVPEQLEPTVTLDVTFPDGPVHESVYVPAADTGADPVIGEPNPVLNPPPVQLVTLTQAHVSVDGTDDVGLAVNVQLGGAAAAATDTSVHGPQLLAVLLSVIMFNQELVLFAHARTVYVPELGNVYEAEDGAVPLEAIPLLYGLLIRALVSCT
jgi:hypothetical protein